MKRRQPNEGDKERGYERSNKPNKGANKDVAKGMNEEAGDE